MNGDASSENNQKDDFSGSDDDFLGFYDEYTILTLKLLTTTIVAPSSNASKWQMGFNSAFKGMNEKPTNTPIIHSVY